MPFGARNSCESSAEASARVDPSLSSIPKVHVFGHSVHIVNNESTSTWSIRKIKSEYRIRNYQFEGIPNSWFKVERNPKSKNSRDSLLFTCLVNGCNKQFTKNSNLRDHFRIHDGKTPFECHLCTKSYT